MSKVTASIVEHINSKRLVEHGLALIAKTAEYKDATEGAAIFMNKSEAHAKILTADKVTINQDTILAGRAAIMDKRANKKAGAKKSGKSVRWTDRILAQAKNHKAEELDILIQKLQKIRKSM